MEIREIVKNFLEMVLSHDSDQEDLGRLIAALDELAYSIRHVDFKFDEKDYSESPKNDYQAIRKVVEKRFPSFGYYNTSLDISEKIGEAEIGIGDAIDDIADIVGDLKEVVWRFENTSTADALWYYEFSFWAHWGKHLRELQLYLHEKMGQA